MLDKYVWRRTEESFIFFFHVYISCHSRLIQNWTLCFNHQIEFNIIRFLFLDSSWVSYNIHISHAVKLYRFCVGLILILYIDINVWLTNKMIYSYVANLLRSTTRTTHRPARTNCAPHPRSASRTVAPTIYMCVKNNKKKKENLPYISTTYDTPKFFS